MRRVAAVGSRQIIRIINNDELAQLIVLVATPLLAQTDVPDLNETRQTPFRGILPTSSYSISDIEAINTGNGNVIFHIPLGGLPPGRGGRAAAGVPLIYNSKLWAAEGTYVCAGVDGYTQWILDSHVNQTGGWPVQHGCIPVQSALQRHSRQFMFNGGEMSGTWAGMAIRDSISRRKRPPANLGRT